MTDAPFVDMADALLIERRHKTVAGKIAYWVSARAGAEAGPSEPPGSAGPVGSTGGRVELVASAGHTGRDKPWLVFLPGLTADHRLFAQQVACFAASANLLVWDPPSHGRSRPFALTWSLDDLATWLREILQAEGVRNPILIGQSMGGYVAQAYLRLYPADARGFVSIDSCPLGREYYTRLELALLRHTKPMYLSIPWGTLVKLGSEGCATTPYGRRLMCEMMDGYDKREYCELAAHGYRVLADAITPNREYPLPCPTLLVCGSKDGAGSARRYNKAWAHRTGLPLHWVDGAGHNSNTDAPGVVNALIEEFVRSLCLGYPVR